MQNESIDYPVASANKPYRVTAYHYTRNNNRSFIVGDYRWYWQANLVSWWWHQLGWGCNTWKKYNNISEA
jgi:hypothetical protein